MSVPRSAALAAALSLLATLSHAQVETTSDQLNLEQNIEDLSNAGDPVVQVSTGLEHACALVQSGRVYCWGANSSGQLGIGSRDGGTNLPVMVERLDNVKQIALGWNHSCALKNSGRVFCWGENAFGQVGNGMIQQDELIRVRVKNGRDAVHIAAGGDNTCMVRENGRAFCWGQNLFGQHGSGNVGLPSSIPVRVVGPVSYTQISVGAVHICGLSSTGRAHCWGRNDRGQLGIGNTDNQSVPNRVLRLTRLTRIATGASFSCALRDDGVPFCWGRNTLGMLGNGTTTDADVPRRVRQVFDGEEIDAGDAHACAVRGNGVAVCWGANDKGALGDGTTTNKAIRERVIRLRGVTQISSGSEFTCATQDTGKAFCWGANNAGQLGKGTTGNDANPVRAQVLFPMLP